MTQKTDKPYDDKRKSRRNHKKSSWTSSGSSNLPSFLALSVRRSITSKALKCEKKADKVEALRTLDGKEKLHTDARLPIISTRKLVFKIPSKCSSYIAKFATKVKLHLKAHFFNTNGPMPIIGFLAALKLACDTNHILEHPATRAQPYYVNETFANALNTRMCTEDKPTHVTASVPKTDSWSQKLWHSYLETVNCQIKKLAIHQSVRQWHS